MSSEHYCNPSTSTTSPDANSSSEAPFNKDSSSESPSNFGNQNSSSDESTTASSCSELDIEDDRLRTWALCPIGYDKAIIITVFIAIYASVFLFYAQHHLVVLLVMTSLIMLWVVCLFTMGMLCVLYMMFRISKMELVDDSSQLDAIVSTITVLETVVIKQDAMDEPVEVKV
ncbi:unnamed protein product [Bursaphelenchus okinawaensis]|uniref:Transmembrane protein n=1 Tax=Bursaphelenchus okinawaensis TaxID=465554 RepID=A0A811KTY3_9BILA|nr:unnamed protein product [Bursaphelenchus okinawaensis]CAG9111413.1 unnamed protein product [Bursaphelenchus okinawaensis]